MELTALRRPSSSFSAEPPSGWQSARLERCLCGSQRSRLQRGCFRPLTPLALALIIYSVAIQFGANGFIAAFVGGMAFGIVLPSPLGSMTGFADEARERLSFVTWFLFGAVTLEPIIEHATWTGVVFAIVALTVVRMIPVAIVCIGLGLDGRTAALIGLVRAARTGLGCVRLARRRHPRCGRCQPGFSGPSASQWRSASSCTVSAAHRWPAVTQRRCITRAAGAGAHADPRTRGARPQITGARGSGAVSSHEAGPPPVTCQVRVP
jgi:hypothetical protein